MCNALKRPQLLYSTGVVDKAVPLTFLTEDERMMKETGSFRTNFFLAQKINCKKYCYQIK